MRWGRRIDRTCELRQVIASWKSKSFRAGARVTFLCVPKEKSPKERAAHRRARRCAPGPQASRGFSKGHPWPIEKRTKSCRAPCGPDPRGLPLRRAIERRRFGKKESKFPTNTSVKYAMFVESAANTLTTPTSSRRIELTANRLDSPRLELASRQSHELPLPLLSTLTLTSTVLRSGGSRGSGPQGARQEAARFSMGQGRPFEKPPRDLRTRRTAPGATIGLPFLLVSFLWASKEKKPAR